jgi:hypothetical protein
MAHKVILPPKKNYFPQFLKQRDINSYIRPMSDLHLHALITEKQLFTITREKKNWSIRLSRFLLRGEKIRGLDQKVDG